MNIDDEDDVALLDRRRLYYNCDEDHWLHCKSVESIIGRKSRKSVELRANAGRGRSA